MPKVVGMAHDFESLSDYELFDELRNPFGTAASGYVMAPHASEVLATQEAAREELRRRGYTDEEIAVLEEGDLSPMQRRRRP